MQMDWILLVEDNAKDVALIKHQLEDNRILHKLVVVRDGAEALQLLLDTGQNSGLETRSNLPEVILLALLQSKVDSLEVLRLMRKNKKSAVVPVVIMTSSNEEEDIAGAYQNSYCGNIRKPVNFSKLKNVTQSLGLHWLT